MSFDLTSFFSFSVLLKLIFVKHDFCFICFSLVFCLCGFSVVLQWMQSMTQSQLFTMTLIYLVVSFYLPVPPTPPSVCDDHPASPNSCSCPTNKHFPSSRHLLVRTVTLTLLGVTLAPPSDYTWHIDLNC